MPIEDQILQFTVLIVAIVAVQLAFRRLHAPALVGLLMVGMIIGPGGMHVVPKEPVVELLGSIGLLYIMFLAGLEIDLDTVGQHKWEAVSFGSAAAVLSFVPAFAVGLLLGLEWAGAALLAAALSSHTLISYPIVEAMGLLRRRSMVAAVGGTLLTDTASLIVLVVVVQVSGAQGGVLGWAGPLLALAAVAAGSILLVPRFSHYVLEVSKASPAERALYAITILMVLSALADRIGTEDILGAFLAGICLNRSVKGRVELLERIVFSGRMLFIPFFFIHTGMELEMEVFGHGRVWLIALGLTAVILLGKAAASWFSGYLFGYSPIERVAMTGLTIPQAAATLAVTTTAWEAGLMGQR
jgi:Kef-type K+ transport system membrane component KefB